MSAIDDIKASFPVPAVLARLYPHWSSRSRTSPFRDEAKPSFSIFDSGRAWYDHGLGVGGDCLDAVAFALGLGPWGRARSRADWQKIFAWFRAQGGLGASAPPPRRPGQGPSAPQSPNAERQPLEPWLKRLEPLQDDHLEQLCAVRTLPLEGVRLARTRGFLFGLTLPGPSRVACWALSDARRRSLLLRRLDAKTFHFGPTLDLKGWTPPGFKMGEPIGLEESRAASTLIVVEGAPDFLAAFCLIARQAKPQEWSALCMPSASSRFKEEHLPFLRRKRLLIYAHQDRAGLAAATSWALCAHAVTRKVALIPCGRCLLTSGEGLRRGADLCDLLVEPPPGAP